MNKLIRLSILIVVALTCSISAYSQEDDEEVNFREQIAEKLREKFDNVIYTDSFFCVERNGVWEFADENGKILTNMRMTNVEEGYDGFFATIQGKVYNFTNSFRDGKTLVRRYIFFGYMDKNGQIITPFIYDSDGDERYGYEQMEDEINKIIDTYDMIENTGAEVKEGNYSSVRKTQKSVASIEKYMSYYVEIGVFSEILCLTLENSPNSVNRDMAEEFLIDHCRLCPYVLLNMIINYFNTHSSNTERKLSFFQSLADDGSSECNMLLGNMYYEGKECPKDIQKAISYYQKVMCAGPTESYYKVQDKLADIWKQYGKTYINPMGHLFTEFDDVEIKLPYLIASKEGKTMVVDTLNQVKLPLGEYMVSEALDDCFIVSSGERYKVVTVGAKPVINDVFDDINLVGDQDAFNIVVKKDNKWGFYNPDGSLITKMIFDNHESIQFLPSTMTINEITYYYSNCYHDGMLVVERDDKYGCLDTTGKEVVPCIYDDILSSKDGVAVVETDGKHGCVDKQGKLIVPCIYDEIDTFHNGKARVKKDDKYGIIDNTGKIITPCKHDIIWVDEEEGDIQHTDEGIIKF